MTKKLKERLEKIRKNLDTLYPFESCCEDREFLLKLVLRLLRQQKRKKQK